MKKVLVQTWVDKDLASAIDKEAKSKHYSRAAYMRILLARHVKKGNVKNVKKSV